MLDVFSDNYMQVVLKPREFLLGIAIAVVPTLDILNADREKDLCAVRAFVRGKQIYIKTGKQREEIINKKSAAPSRRLMYPELYFD